VDSLPSLPTIYNEINNKIDLPETSAREIGEIVATDIAMSAKVLQLVNSSFFGLRTKILNPIDAVLMLGFNTIKSLILSIKIFKKLSENVDPNIAKDLWEHSMKVGQNNKNIAEYEGVSKKLQYDYFSSGMLLDLGKLFFLAYFPKEYKMALEIKKERGVTQTQAEKEIFGSTNYLVAAYMMTIWGLPGSLIFSCAFNQEYEKHFDGEYNDIISLYFANLFADDEYDLKTEFQKMNNREFESHITEWEKICN
jgi:HD-like signal output (HDOD) protein